MLTLRFNPEGRRPDDRIIIDPPYELVATWIVCDVQGSPFAAKHYAQRLRAVIDGSSPPIEWEEGNMWRMDADPEWTTLTQAYGEPRTVRVPTRWLLDAVERWWQHLIDRGVPIDQ